MIGICGISGIGKTTLAKAIYNFMYVHFEGSCFCDDVRKQQDLTQVQMQMIGKIMKTENFKISSVAQGAMVIKQRISCKPVLLVLDDVDDHEQLEALAGSPTWFCPGSLIIFTGKDKQLLRSHRVEIHDMKFLDKDKSLELFYSFAFEEKKPSTGFKEVSKKVVKYVQGHPLALKVLGRFLYGKTVGEWVSELDQLKVHPNEKIQRVLRLSYDGLNLHQQNILLDTACLFIGENSEYVASILDGCNFFADTNMRVLVDKSLITISSNMSLQMHDLIQAMARAIVREESIMPGKQRRLLISSNVYQISGQNKVAITEAVEVLVLLLEKFGQKVHIDANDFAHMKNLRILKIYQEEKVYEQKHELKGHNVIFSGNLYYLSNELSLFYWHGCPFKYLPSDFYPQNIVAIDLSYSNIKHIWTTPKCFKRLKVMKLRYCCNLTTTPDFSEITNLEELNLEGCVNMVSVHPSIGMLKRLVVLNLRDCKRLQNFPSRVEMDALKILNLTGCLKVDQLPEALGRIKSLTELHVHNTAITELPSFVSSLMNLESLSFGGQGRIQPRWWTEMITAPFGLLSKQQHPQRSIPSLAGLHMLKDLNFSYCNLLQIPESIGGLSCLKKLNLEGNNLLEVPESIGGLSCLRKLELQGNNFTSLPGSLSQLSQLEFLHVDGCKKLEVLPEVPLSIEMIDASDCTSLREVLGSSMVSNTYRRNIFRNCPKMFKNVSIDSEGSMSMTECLDSSIASQGSINQAFLRYMGFQTGGYKFFAQDSGYSELDIVYHGNSIPEWFTSRSTENHVNVELPSDWCYDKLKGYGACVVFKRKKPCKFPGLSVKNFDGASLTSTSDLHYPDVIKEFLKKDVIGIHESYMVWLLYYRRRRLWEWKEAKNFVTFSFLEKNNEDIEVKECGARVVCHGDLQQDDITNLGVLQDPSQHGGAISLTGANGYDTWSW
ncbi:NB-ARC domains-containing protein [Tanacetum coccineum]